MRGKCWLGVLLALAMLLCGGCVRQEAEVPVPEDSVSGTTVTTEEFVRSEAQNLAELVGELASSQSYVRLMSSNAELMALSNAVAGSLYGQPRAIARLDVDFDTLLAASMGEYDAEEYGPVALSDTAREQLERRMSAAVGNLINGQYGDVWIAVASMLSVEASYLQPADWAGNVSLLLEYDGCCVYVAFVRSGDGVITAAALPVAAATIDEAEQLLLELQPVITYLD